MRDKYLFDTWSACCEGMFDGTVGCGHSDTCRNDVANDGFHTSGGHEVSGCKGRMWHPDNSALLPTCTNTLHSYPPYWETPQMKGVFMFDTPDKCCDMLNSQEHGNIQPRDNKKKKKKKKDGDCIIKEAHECREAQHDTENCYPWHPAVGFNGCSNSPFGTYPGDWTVPGVSERYLLKHTRSAVVPNLCMNLLTNVPKRTTAKRECRPLRPSVVLQGINGTGVAIRMSTHAPMIWIIHQRGTILS